MRKLRRFYSPSVEAAMYDHTYNSKRWPEHITRIEKTAAICQTLIDRYELKSVADLSCGDGSLIDKLSVHIKFARDGNIMDDMELIGQSDLFICTETIEHLREPWTVLERIAEKTRWLVLSTPLDEERGIDNYEHYWAFTTDDVATMLHHANFHHIALFVLQHETWNYRYQVWTAEVNNA